jgi:hypothetical protein
MIQIGTICISESMIPFEYELAKHSLFIMESNVHRMKYMMELGYFCSEYSEDEWKKFKKVEILLRNRHSNVEYHTKNKT